MSPWTRGPLAAVLAAVGVTAVLTLGSGSALADPDQPPPPPAPVDQQRRRRARRPAGAAAAGSRCPAGGTAAGRSVCAPATARNPFAPPPAAPAAVPSGPVAGQNPAPFTGEPPFVPPTFNPVSGATVGVGEPIIINFGRPIADQPMAEQAIHISSTPPVPGKFYWLTPSQVRWRPLSFWPAHTAVHVDAAGTIEDFRTGDR